jgi:hypothetical protein
MDKLPTNQNEGKKGVEDNARKFTLDNIDPAFLAEHGAVSFKLILDWLETGEDNDKKLAYKEMKDGEVQTLLISKVTENGNRSADRKKISVMEYMDLLKSSVVRVEKTKHEFKYEQEGITFTLKYDVFSDGRKMLEVDAPSEKDRNKFKPEAFPYKITEVTGNMDYYGYRVAKLT